MADCRFYDIEFCSTQELSDYIEQINSDFITFNNIDYWTCDKLEDMMSLTSFFVYYDNNGKRKEVITDVTSDARKREIYNTTKRHFKKLTNFIERARENRVQTIYLSDEATIRDKRLLEKMMAIEVNELKYCV